MHPSESPFPCYWWGTDLEDAGLGEVRPRIGTYGRYEYAPLPPLPFDLHGNFGWLMAAPPHESSIGNEKAAENVQSLISLRESSAQFSLPLPEAFVKFMETAYLHQRIRSNTDCFLDLCPNPVRSPVGDGYLIRFLADSQGCVFWYLYLTPNGSDHAVVSSPCFYGTDAEKWQEEEPDPIAIVFAEESFERFMCRFWLENEIWYADWEKTPMPDAGRKYIEQYRRKE